MLARAAALKMADTHRADTEHATRRRFGIIGAVYATATDEAFGAHMPPHTIDRHVGR